MRYKNKTYNEKLRRIKLLACDFDGVMTDGHVFVGQDGRETVHCSRRDGLGVALLKKAGISVCVISSEANPVVKARCDKLAIPCHQKVESSEGKADVLRRVALEQKLNLYEVAFVGDDVNDLAALKIAGVAFTVADGHKKVKEIAHYVTRANGGKHAVREICEVILEAQGKELKY